MRRRRSFHAATAWVLTLLALVGGMVQVAWFLGGGEAPVGAAAGYVPRQVGYGLFVLSAAGLGATILAKAPPRQELSLVAIVLALMGVPFLDSGAGRAAAAIGTPKWLVDGVLSLGFLMALAATLRLSRSFPNPVSTGRWGRRAPWLGALLAWIGANVGLFPLTPAVGTAMALAVAFSCLFNYRTLFRAADAEGRRRILWLAQGMVAFTVVAALQVALTVLVRVTPLRIGIPGWEYWLRLAALFAGLLFLAVAVFYRGALDPALVLRRTALYGLAGVALVFVFTAIEDLTSSWLAERLGLGENAGSWFAGGVVALLLGPLHAALGRAMRTGDRESHGA